MRGLFLDGEGLRLREDLPQPLPGPDEALIRVVTAGICGTDRELCRGYRDFVGIPGHEFVGVVEQSPDPAWLGKRVVGEINLPCRTCPVCLRGDGNHCPQRQVLGILGRNGAFAEYLALPVANLHPVPEGLGDRQAVFVEPLAAVLEILERHPVRPGERVAVVGDGRLGSLVVGVMLLAGCEILWVGRHMEKMAEYGVARFLEHEAWPREWAERVVECSGGPGGLNVAMELVRPRGVIHLKSTWAGMAEMNLSPLVVREVTLKGTRCGPFSPALRLLEMGWILPRHDLVLPMEQGVEGFALAGQGNMVWVENRTQ